MASITQKVEHARTYMQMGLGLGVDLALDSLMKEIEEGRVLTVADVVTWVRDSRARLEEHHAG